MMANARFSRKALRRGDRFRMKICCAKLDGRRACRKQQLKVCVLIDGELLANEASVRHRTTSMACYNKLYRLSHDGD